jgi:hypothetical protein
MRARDEPAGLAGRRFDVSGDIHCVTDHGELEPPAPRALPAITVPESRPM